MKVTLTFDNGPTKGVTESVLDVLRARQIPATFFVVGNSLAEPGAMAIAERAAGEGHWIGNHTLTHEAVFGEHRDRDTADREIGGTQNLLGSLVHPDRLFRPIGKGALGDHLLSPSAVKFLCEGGYSCVLWTSVPRDWEPDGLWVNRCLDDVATCDWSVVVLHDLPTGAMADLPRLIDRLEAAGAEFVQDFPDDCVPIRRGKIVAPLDAYMRTV